MIEFTDSATALLFEALTEHDHWLEIPPDKKGECKCQAYRGLLSNIDEHAAERYLTFGGNLIRAKAENEIDTSTVAEIVKNTKQDIDNNNDFESEPNESVS